MIQVDPLDENDVIRRLESKTQELVKHLQEDDLSSAFAIIQQINATKEEGIYHGLGVLARGLHTAIHHFELDEHGKSYLAHDSGAALHVTGQLDNVVKMNEESARKTLDVLDRSMPLVRELNENAVAMSSAAEGSQAEQMQRNVDGLKEIDKNFTEILMAQGYQDLAGQAIKKVIELLDETQTNLLHLLSYANEVKSLSIPLKLDDLSQGAEANGSNDESDAVAEPETEDPMGQDDVDDLLSSLGF